MHNEAENVIGSWLALQSKLIPGSLRAVVMLGEQGAEKAARRRPRRSHNAVAIKGKPSRAKSQAM